MHVGFLYSYMGFLEDYFIDPILTRGGYNPVNTIVYLLILLVVVFGFIYPALKKRKIAFDATLAFSLLGYIAWGSSMRILEDAHMLVRSANPFEIGFYFFTPGIYILVGLTAIILLLLTHQYASKINQPYWRVFAFLGWLIALPFIIWNITHIQNLVGVAWIIGMWVVVVGLGFLVMRLLQQPWFEKSRLSQLSFAGQALDGSATFVAIQSFGFSEQHVVSAGVLSIHPLLFPAIKFALALLILYLLEKEIQDENQKGFIQLLLMILGFAPGLRDLLLLGVLGGPMIQPLF